MQVLSFISMGLIFYTITVCSTDDVDGVCAYRQEMSMVGTCIMLGMIGLRYVRDKTKNKKKPNHLQKVNT
jgi:hypothetical protein